MLKRLLAATAVAASALVISGPITAPPANAADGTDARCTTVEQGAAPRSGTTEEVKPKCRFRERYGNWCKFCYKYGGWRLQYCEDM
jgi:invasion protein IalB